MSDVIRSQALGRIGLLAKRLRQAMEQPGMTARNIAAFSGTDKSAVSRAKNQKSVSTENFLMLEIWMDSNGL